MYIASISGRIYICHNNYAMVHKPNRDGFFFLSVLSVHAELQTSATLCCLASTNDFVYVYKCSRRSWLAAAAINRHFVWISAYIPIFLKELRRWDISFSSFFVVFEPTTNTTIIPSGWPISAKENTQPKNPTQYQCAPRKSNTKSWCQHHHHRSAGTPFRRSVCVMLKKKIIPSLFK